VDKVGKFAFEFVFAKLPFLGTFTKLLIIKKFKLNIISNLKSLMISLLKFANKIPKLITHIF